MNETAITSVVDTEDDQIPVRFEVDVEKLNRKDRRTVEANIKDYRRRYRNVKSENGERPTLVFRRGGGLLRNKIEVVLEFSEALKSHVAGSENAVKVA